MTTLTTRSLAAALALTMVLGALSTTAYAAPPRVARSPPTYVICDDGPGSCARLPVAGRADPLWRRTCGWVSCTIYFNRNETRDALVAGGVVLGVIAKFGSTVGWAIAAVVGPVAATAYNHGMCLKLKFGVGYSTPVTPFTPMAYRDGGDVCR